MIPFKNIIILINIAFILSLITWIIWVCNRYKFKKRGDPVVSPPYQKTYYLENKIASDYDFHPFFNLIHKNIHNKKTIHYYKWFLYYDEQINFFYKAELICYYKIGIQKTVLKFQTNKLFFKDKKGVLHLTIDLIIERKEENFLSAELHKLKDPFWNKKTDLQKVVNSNNVLIGYNKQTGDIQYEIIIENKC